MIQTTLDQFFPFVGQELKQQSQNPTFQLPQDSEFANLHLAPYPFVGRKICPNCSMSYSMYCPYCTIPLPGYQPPKITLPLSVDIIHHPKEKRTKSTAIHLCILCPEQAHMYEFPDVPDYDPNTTICLFPSPQSEDVTDIKDWNQINKVVFIDSTWQQTGGICIDKRIQKLRKVQIHKQQTKFWRVQDKSPEYLATIEAIYYFFKEYAVSSAHMSGNTNYQYNGEYDNLLWYYVYQYERIQSEYIADKDKQVSKKLKQTYIRARRSKSEADQSGRSEDGDEGDDIGQDKEQDGKLSGSKMDKEDDG
ncbi:MAG: putative DTW domain protein [Streblomastix strix]|uniref:tRNA-uridine aminocarboxypropyltransferase 1 n=1 Tax=Streblomastix strix TaxID=222440 RepID=A0A5J4V347_9EUKA|nr:MAG: putative DTW domain protein [Streblomastix strix]